MATIDHEVLSTKTLSAPNPISMVYKKFAFFDDNTNTLRFTHSGTLFDLEIKKIHNNLTFTNTVNVEGNFGGALPTAPSTDAIISGSVSQLFSDMYSGAASGQVVDSEDFTPAVSDYVFVDGNVDIPGGSKYGILHSLRLEADKRYERDEELDANQQSIETFLVGAGSGWTHDNTITFNSIVNPEAPYFLSAETSLAGAMQKIDAELKNLQSFVTSMWNEVSGSDQSISEPSPGGLTSPNWENDLFSMGSGVGSASTYYLASTGNVFIPRPDGTSNSESINSVSSRSAFLELDKELRRNEVWTNKINKYLNGDNLNSESTSGGALAFSQDTTQWTGLTNVPSDGTYFRPWNPLAQAPTGIVPTNLSQALRNLDANIRMIKHRADINYRADGTNVGLMSDNPNRGNIQDLRADINAISNSFNNDSANSTSSGVFAYVPETNEYATSDSIGLAIHQLDDNLEKLANRVYTTSDTDGYTSIVPGSVDVVGDVNWLYMEGWQTTNSLNNRLGKVVDSGSNIVITDHADTSDNKFIRYPAGQDFSGAPNDPAYGLTGSDWGKYLVNKNYVDGVTNGLIYRPWVRLVSNTNLDLNGSETIDGVATVDGDRILCINQTTTTENGVYVANHSGDWERADDMDTGDTALRTWTFWVDSGTAYGNKHLNVSGDTTTYTVGTNAMTGWTIITRVFGLQNGIGTTSDTDRFDVNAGKSLYTDGTDGSTLNVNIAGESGQYSGSPYSDAWVDGERSNELNPIAYLDGAGSASGLTLKYTSDFSLSGAGELQIDEVGGITGSGIVWSYDTSKYAESATPGDSGSGSTSLFWGDASDGANRWARLRAFADESTAQGANLGTDGKPQFAALGVGMVASAGEPDGTNYIFQVKDTSNAAKVMINCEQNEDALLAFWTGETGSNTLKGLLGYDHSSSLMKFQCSGSMASTDFISINGDGEVGIGIAPQAGATMTLYDENPSIWLINDTANEDESASIIMTETTDEWATSGSYGFRIKHDGDYTDSGGGANGAFKIQTTNNGTVKTPVTIDRATGFVGLGAAFADAGTGPIIPDAPLHLFSSEETVLKIESNDANACIMFEDKDGGVDYNAYVGAQKNGVFLGKANTWGSSDNIHVKDGKLLVGGNANTVTTTNPTSNPAVPLEIRNGTDLDLSVGSGYLQIGDNTSHHLKFDINEIQSITGNADQTSDGTAQDLYINPHGGVVNINYSTNPYLNLGSNAGNATHSIDISSQTPHIHLGDSNNDNAAGTPVITFGMETQDPTFATTGYYMKLGPWKYDGTPNRHMYYSLDAQSLYNTGASSNGHLTQHKFEIGEVEVMRIHRACVDDSEVSRNGGGVSINAKNLDDHVDGIPLRVHGHTNQHCIVGQSAYATDTEDTSFYSILDLRRYRGSASAKVAVGDDDGLGMISFAGYTGNGTWGDNTVRGAAIYAQAEGTVDTALSNHLPTKLIFETRYAQTRKLAMQMHPDGKIQVGDTSSTPDAQLHVKANTYTKQLRLERTGTGPWKADIGVRDLGTNDEALTFYVNEGYDNTVVADGVFTNNATHYMKKNGEFWSKGSIFVGGAGAITLNTSGLITTNNIDVATHVHLKTGADLKMSTSLDASTASPIIENTDDTAVSINSLGGQLKLGHRTCSEVKLMVDLINSSGQTLIDQSAKEFAGTAAKAAQLETARTIGGVSFSGASNINLPGVNTQGGYADNIKTTALSSGTQYILGVSTQTSNGQQVYNDAAVKFNDSGDLFCTDLLATGDVVCNYSDERLKNIKGNIESPLDKIATLNGFYYTPNDEAVKLGVEPDKEEVGVSAQEVAAIMPEAVAPSPVKSPTEEYLTVRYERLVPLLIESIKELKAEIDELKRSK